MPDHSNPAQLDKPYNHDRHNRHNPTAAIDDDSDSDSDSDHPCPPGGSAVAGS